MEKAGLGVEVVVGDGVVVDGGTGVSVGSAGDVGTDAGSDCPQAVIVATTTNTTSGINDKFLALTFSPLSDLWPRSYNHYPSGLPNPKWQIRGRVTVVALPGYVPALSPHSPLAQAVVLE